MTTAVITDWKEMWQEFYNEALEKTWNSELSPEVVKVRLKMLDYTNENIDVILAKLDDIQPIFSHLSEALHVLHQFLDCEDDYQSVNFQKTINEHIQIRLEPNDCTAATIEVECLIEIENDYLSFVIDEHDPKELKISMKS